MATAETNARIAGVIALIVTPEGFPLSYEVLAGNTADNTTLGDFLIASSNDMGMPIAFG